MAFAITVREGFLNLYHVLSVDYLFALYLIKMWKRVERFQSYSENSAQNINHSLDAVVRLCIRFSSPEIPLW